MKSVWLLCLIGVIIAACNKASTTTPAGTPPPVTPPADTTIAKDTVVTAPPPIFDSTTLVESKWSAYRDSIVNVNYDDPYGGYPIPGVIHNIPGDYWNFLPNGVLEGVISGLYHTGTYNYWGTNLITIGSPPDSYPNPCVITTLTTSTFIFACTDTSSMGGTYYRQVWLKK